ncbi:MAG: hypothetical protein A4E55_01782 [Pelotomaculum sp. PtaU1.Bin035]|nr:MAG: hypothetical protein A4E55_01782 [Pelotomaculum sp. PtaU1.Bin035]
MPSNEDFIRQSLDLDLFFLRIMKEHSFFLEGGFTPVCSDLASQADAFKKQFEGLLKEAVSLADACINPDVASSGEIVTEFTLNAERASEFFTGIPIDTSITTAELALTQGMQQLNTQMLVQRVVDLNQRAIAVTQELINFKTTVLNGVLSCRLFTFNYPLLIDHIRREAILFVTLLTRLQQRMMADITGFAIEQESFWNRIMAEHAKFIRGLLDPTEEALFEIAHNFGKEFDVLTARALAIHNQVTLLPQVTQESLNATVRIRDFKRQGTEGILACKIRSIILPLLGDHVLREANHYLRLLRTFSMIA